VNQFLLNLLGLEAAPGCTRRQTPIKNNQSSKPPSVVLEMKAIEAADLQEAARKATRNATLLP
jgi:hypothetical protein